MTSVEKISRPVVLAIAGFDPSGGAGTIADLRTIESFGCHAVAAITSLTFQNAKKYFGAINQTAESVRTQIEVVIDGAIISAVKIGMLPTAEVVGEVARLIQELKLPPPVVDPVMESSSGGKLMADNAFELFVTELLPLARIVTPNLPEAEKLAGMNIHDEDRMREAAARIRELGAHAVLIKGGHLTPRLEARDQKAKRDGPAVMESRSEAIDVLDDNGEVTLFRGEWIEGANVRGTGCMLSSAIAASLANGDDLSSAVAAAKRFVLAEIHESQVQHSN